MQNVWFVNALGEEARFDDAPPYIFWKITGTGLPESDALGFRAPGRHGYTANGILMKKRSINVSGHVQGGGSFYQLRKSLMSVLSPALGMGKLYYQNDSQVFFIPAFVKRSGYEDKESLLQTVNFTFECPSPFWRGADKAAIDLFYAGSGLEFPLVLPSMFGMLGRSAKIFAAGGAPVPVEFFIKGNAVNPVIRNVTTSQEIKLKNEFLAGDMLYINTDRDALSVQKIAVDPNTNETSKENAFGYLTDDSELFYLQPGENFIKYMSDEEDDNYKSEIRLEYYDRFAGV